MRELKCKPIFEQATPPGVQGKRKKLGSRFAPPPLGVKRSKKFRVNNVDSPIYLSTTCFGFRHVHMVFDLSSKVDICFETQFSIVSDARCARTRLPVDLLHIPGISLFEMENICSNLCFRISICEMENICCIYVFLTSELFAVGVLVLFPSNDVFLKSRSILTASPPLAILPRPPLPFLGNNPHLPPCSSS